MNVLFLTSTLPRRAGDHQAPFVLEQAQAWKKSRPNDKVIILAPDDIIAQKKETIGGIDVIRFSYWWPRKWQALAYPAILPNIQKNYLLLFQLVFFLLNEFFSAWKISRTHNINLIYAHWVMPQGLISFFIKKITGISYVLQNHSSDLIVFNKLPFFGKPLARAIIRNAAAMFCVNRLLRQTALSLFNDHDRTQMEQKIHCLPMGVHLQPPPNISQVHHQSMYDFGIIGRLTKKKGIDLFFNALKVLQQHTISCRVGVAGDGEEFAALQQAGRTLGVKFLGFVNGQQKFEFFNNTRFLLFPSVPAKGDVEGLPVALLEALYCGKIVLASRATNIEMLPEWEAIKEGVYLLDDPYDPNEFADKLKMLLALSEEKTRIIGKNVAVIIEKYKWENLIEEYFNFILNNAQRLDKKTK